MPARVFKWTAIGLGALLVLAVVCGVLLRLLLDPNDYRTQVELAFNERTGRTLELEGTLGLRILPRLAVSTGPFSISGRPGTGDGDFLTARDARLGLALLPLLQRRLEFGVLTLVEPVLSLRVDADGRDNWSDLLERPAPPDPLNGEEPEAAAPVDDLDLHMAGLAINDGRVSLDDARDQRHWRLAALELSTGRLDLAESTAVRAGFDLLDGDTLRLHANVTGRVAQPRPRAWTVQDLDAAFDLPASEARTVPVAARITVAQLGADLEARRYTAPGMRYRLGDARGEASLEASHTDTGFVVHGPVKLERTDLRALLASFGLGLPRLADPGAPGELELSASLRYGPGLELRDLVARLGETHYTGSVESGVGSPAPLRFDLRGDRLDADDWRPAPPGADAAPVVPARADGNSRLRALDVIGRLSLGRLSIAGIELRDFEGRMILKDGVLDVDPVQAALFGGNGSARLHCDLRGTVPAIALEPRLVNVDVAALLGQLVGQRRLSGRGNFSAKLTGAGADSTTLLPSLAGPFETRITGGRVEGIDLWAAIEGAVAAAGGATGPRHAGSGYTPFDLFEAQGQFVGKRIDAERFVVANSALRAQGAGTVDYGSGALDLALTARLLEAPEGKIAGIPLDRIVGVDVPLTVRGTLAEPRVRPDVDRLLESAARQHLQQEGEKVEKKLKDKLNETLKDLFGQ